jgi:hypothetical protein
MGPNITRNNPVIRGICHFTVNHRQMLTVRVSDTIRVSLLTKPVNMYTKKEW